MTRIRLVAFDLDGTLVHGDTVCEALARGLGHLDHMRELEAIQEARRDRESLRALRETLAGYYRGVPPSDLRAHLRALVLAPGAREGLALLRRHGVETAIVTITWDFAAQWLAGDLGIDHWIGTRLEPDGAIAHIWPEDKARWLRELMARRGRSREDTAAVGDSWRDVEMLRAAGHAYYVGPTLPAALEAVHVPHGDLLAIARAIVHETSIGVGREPSRPTAARRASSTESVNRVALVSFAPEHAAGTVEVIRAVFEEYGMTFDLEDFDRDLQDIPEHYAGRGGAFWVLLDTDRVVGTVAVVPKDPATAELKRLYVLSRYRGAGHGRRLVEQVVSWTRAGGYRSVVAWSDVRFATAHQVYRRIGFRQIGDRTLEDIDRSREYGFALDLSSRGGSSHQA